MAKSEKTRCSFEYDPSTGEFTGLRVKVDRDGYLFAFIDRKKYLLHRLVFLMEGLDISGKIVDHIDCDRQNNRRDNLRLVTPLENAYNRKINNNNTSGYKGITQEPNGKWRARISANKRRYSLGVFDSLESAAEALREERQKLHGEYANEG
ncbi:HNH endonuclease [Escherichia phage phiEco32]|uniref:HNH endonuclease n=1 Tax=Escherichia phage Phieco32 TaxID=2679905 RepID=B0FIJ3_BPE32|nr:HNH endonuclease [Escherichia phage phiEco32]ABY52832.1 HNH endonuclease [Escherichia phage phiEco32]